MLNQKTIGIALIFFSLLLIILLSLVKVDIDERDTLLCSAVYSDPGLEMADCPAHKGNTSWLLLIIFGISFAMLTGGAYMLFSTWSKVNKEGSEGEKVTSLQPTTTTDPSKLNEEEKKIIELIREANGSVYQSNLVEKTGFSKVKITRILDKLEHDDHLIERKRRGMTNIVVLK